MPACVGLRSVTNRRTSFQSGWLALHDDHVLRVEGVGVDVADVLATQHDYLASGSGRSWNRYTLLVVPFPPSIWKGARVLIVAQRPRPFQPAPGSSMRPSSHLV